MYVAPTEWRKGWGRRFVAFAKSRFPEGLQLHTHQDNRAARALYEKHGFRAVRFGLSPPPERAPDVKYIGAHPTVAYLEYSRVEAP